MSNIQDLDLLFEIISLADKVGHVVFSSVADPFCSLSESLSHLLFLIPNRILKVFRFHGIFCFPPKILVYLKCLPIPQWFFRLYILFGSLLCLEMATFVLGKKFLKSKTTPERLGSDSIPVRKVLVRQSESAKVVFPCNFSTGGFVRDEKISCLPHSLATTIP